MSAPGHYVSLLGAMLAPGLRQPPTAMSVSWGLCQPLNAMSASWGYVSALGAISAPGHYVSLLGATSVTWGQKLDKEEYSSSSTLNLVSTRTLNGLLRSTQHTEMNTADASELAA